jgi:para-aminobenzoate synthetase component 1
VNLCRVLSASLSPPISGPLDIGPLFDALTAAHPSPYGALVSIPDHDVHVASASPERFLRRDGRRVESRPIKGTASTAGALAASAKDRAENVMIVDLVRNDLGRVCEWGSVVVDELCRVERHPGLAHLVSTVSGRLRPGVGWADVLAAAFPPGSVTGAPKLAALDHIAQLEPVSRGVYCGAVGWVDADRDVGDLNVAIRTFWADDGRLHFGTGAGITWDSDAAVEWDETELKASRLLAVAARGPGR